MALTLVGREPLDKLEAYAHERFSSIVDNPSAATAKPRSAAVQRISDADEPPSIEGPTSPIVFR